MRVDYDDITRMLGGAIEIIRQKNAELSLLDAAIGDGDHGVTMLRAMEKMSQVIETHPEGKISDLLTDIGWALLDIDGGATGPLYGSLLLGMAEGAEDNDTLDQDSFVMMFERGLESISQQTKARTGDKTLMDALIPAVASLRDSARQGIEIRAMMDSAANAAMLGAETTKNFPARYGRAKFQGERTIGHPDPGAISMAYVFQGLRDGLKSA